MSNIRLKRSAIPGKVPTVEQLDLGELAINTYDGKMFLKKHQEYFDDALQETITLDEVVEFSSHVPVENTLYVQASGDNNSNGDSWSTAFATIEKAVEAAWDRNGAVTLIHVGPGVYTTRGHIDVPDDTIIHGVYRSVFIRPESGYEERNVFRLGSGSFIEGFVFENFRLDSLDNPTEGFAAVFRPGARIIRTPYVHKIAVRTTPYWTTVAPPLDRNNANPLVGRGAGVVLADGAVIDPDSVYPNIMTWGATPVTHNGIGYCAKNGALINAVNAISIWCHKHFLAQSGGQIVLSACSTQFGDYTLVSEGTRYLISPNEVDVALVVDETGANAINNAVDTIVSNLLTELGTQGFKDNWPSFYDTLTERDARLFLQSLEWVIRSGNEKPMLDYSRGFFNTAGDRAFTSLPYNYDKCYRDTGFITEAIAYDVLFNSNYRSINAALAYYRANASQVITTELTNTIAAITKQKTVIGEYLTGTSLTRSNALFDEIIDIITNGESAADAYSYPDPTDYDAGYYNARRLILSNKTFIQDEIDAWIAYQIANNISPFSTGFTYDSAACRRDVGLIINALIYDLTYGGNLETYNAAMAYFVGTTSQFGTGEKAVTLATYAYLKSIIDDVAQAGAIVPTLGNSTSQDTSGTAGSIAAATFAQDRIQDIYDTINTDGTAPTVILPDLTWPADEFTISYNELITNKTAISESVMTYLSNIDTDYNFDKCYRDTLLINEAVAYDMLFETNFRSIKTGLAYYRAAASKVISDQKTVTLEALVRQKATFGSYLSGTSLTRANALFDEIIDIVTNGEGAASAFSIVDPVGYDTGFFNARRLLVSNKTFIQDEIDAWIAYQITNNISPFSTGFTYDSAACRRDVGFIIDALRYDLTYGGNLETYNAAVAYFVGTTAQYGAGEKAVTLATYTYLRSILDNIVQGIAITPTTGNSTSQDTSGTAGSVAAATFVKARIDNITTTISTDGDKPAKILPNTTWPATEFQTSFATVNTNANNIANDVLRYINVENKTLFGAIIYSWEYMRDQVKALGGVGSTTDGIVDALVDALFRTVVNPTKISDPSVITAIGHTWTGIMAGVALTKMPPAYNQNTIQESILELDSGVVIASGQDDQGSALFIGGMKIDADTGELTGPPFDTAVNRIATRAAIARSF